MSEFAARAALSRMNNHEILLAPAYGASALASDFQTAANTDPDEAQVKFLKQRRESCAHFGFDVEDDEQDKPFAFADGIAIIPITGTLINRFSWSYGFLTGYNFIRSQLKAALGDEDVVGIIFDVNSYGGEAAGCFELAQDIFESRAIKPSLAVVDSNSYSAGYALASAATRMVVTPSAGVGSIGVIAMHMDISKMLDDVGVKITLIYEGEHKADGNPYEPLSKEALANVKAGIHQSYEKFVALVATQRGVDEKVVRDTQSRTLRADEALSLGLIDAIATPSEAVHAFLGELSGSNLQLATKEVTMTATTKPGAPQAGNSNEDATRVAADQAAAEARTAERARVDGIMNCEEAKGREAQATYFATKTGMSVEEAKGALAAAPKAAAPAPAPAAAATAPAPSPLDAAMAASGGGANVGADNTNNGGQQEQLTPAQQILRDQAAVTGVQHKAK